MKKLSLFALAAAGLLLGACTDKDTVNEVVQTPEFTDGAFIGISIQLPSTTATTRANEQFKDGDANEWDVKDANLLIFKTTATDETEDDAVYVATYALPIPAVIDGDAATGNVGDHNVEATLNKATQIENALAAEITGSPEATKYYAYVIVNANGQIPALSEGETTFGDFKDLQFNEIGADIAAECNIHTGGLLMTNAPVSAAAGGGDPAPTEDDNYTTLVVLDKTKIFSSEDLATKAGNQAACVYVERAAVKVTLNAASVTTAPDLGDVEIVGWQIINYEPTYWNTRKVEAAWGALASDYVDGDNNPLTGTSLYRFVSPKEFEPKVPGAHTGPFRTYFAKDVQYAENATLSKTVAGDTWIDAGKSAYTTENTFDVEHQTWRNTTQVTVKATVNGGTGFFVVPGNPDFLTLANAKTQLETNIKSLLTVQNAFSAVVKELPALEAPAEYSLDVQVTITEPTAGSNDVEYTATVGVKNGTADVTIPSDAAAKMTALEEAVEDGVDANVVSYYKGGETYYNARIKHFGDVETPWSSTKPWEVIMPGTTVQQIYGFGQNPDLSAKRFLGRYGVVRDNWYDLTVDAINKLGSAEPIDVTDNNTPDDEVENYISIHVHIIPWVLRTQHITF